MEYQVTIRMFGGTVESWKTQAPNPMWLVSCFLQQITRKLGEVPMAGDWLRFPIIESIHFDRIEEK